MHFQKVCISIVLFSTCLFAQSSTMWQTTHFQDWATSGNCRLEATSIRATIHPLAIDVEEEAVVGTISNGWWSSGDSTTLEITGEFAVSPGTVVRSMLLWNGATILKATLKDRSSANKEYEDVVDRDKPVVIARDPALIEYLGDNLYRFKIYPVALGSSRTIRILYTIPITGCATGIGFEIKPAFLFGCDNRTPSTVPITITVDKQTSVWYIEDVNKKREVQSGGTYMVPTDAFYTLSNYSYYYSSRNPSALRITTKSPETSWAKQYSVSDGTTAGNYLALALSVNEVFSYILNKPELLDDFFDSATLKKLDESQKTVTTELLDRLRAASSVEAIITIGDAKYVLDGNNNKTILSFIKTAEAWDQQLSWNVYNKEGVKVVAMQQHVSIDNDTTGNTLLPLLWAAKYTFKEKIGMLGGSYGFVDQKMSLLALESDTLPKEVASKYNSNGVPQLLPEEILPGVSGGPKPPAESALFEYETKITTAAMDHVKTFQLQLLKGNLLQIAAKELDGRSPCSIIIFDLSGRILFRQDALKPINHRVSVALPHQLKGTCVVQITSGKFRQIKQFTLQ